jgi:hypothetical protein
MHAPVNINQNTGSFRLNFGQVLDRWKYAPCYMHDGGLADRYPAVVRDCGKLAYGNERLTAGILLLVQRFNK